jgi:hypothetical protein
LSARRFAPRQHACFAGLSAFLPFWPRSAARDEPPPAALGFYVRVAARDDFAESEARRA